MSTPPSQTGSLNNDKDISPSINSHAPISSASCMQPSREAQNSSNPNADPVPSSPMSQSSEDAEEITRIPRCDWDGLQSRFSQTMEEKSNEENEIRKEFESLTAFYNVWGQTSALKEEERCAKRLRTRIAYVQNRELQLDEKRDHHEKVVLAFQNALALLG